MPGALSTLPLASGQRRIDEPLVILSAAARAALSPSAYRGAQVQTDDGLRWYSDGTAWRLLTDEARAQQIAAAAVQFTAIGTGAVTRTVQARLRDEGLSIRDFGAVGNGVADDTAAIQAAIDAAHAAGGGTVRVPFGRYRVARVGNHIAGRGYCLVLRSNVTIDADFGATIFNNFVLATPDVDVIVTASLGDLDNPGNTNITVRNLVVETVGTNGAQGGGFGYWFLQVLNLTMDGAVSRTSTSWGIRIEQCDTVDVRWARSQQGADINADGLHFKDCRNVIANCQINTLGDDGLIVEAFNYNIWNYHITAVVRAPVTVAAAGRGVLILNDHPTLVREIKNVYISASVYDCKGQAFVIDGGCIAENIRADIVARDCSDGLFLVAGSGGKAGAIRNCQFNIAVSDTASQGVFAATNGGVIENNYINATIWNPSISGGPAATLAGDRWTGEIVINYNPYANKTSFSFGLDMFAKDSLLRYSGRGASANLHLRTGATGNTFYLGNLIDATVRDIEVQIGTPSANAATTRFIGGSVGATSNTNLCTFVGVGGAGASATFTTTDGKTVVVAGGVVRSVTP